ncbi:MAG: hypothetical protein PHI97_31545 [Desulfobulbus sp.]|nr:hypothetical protein [Desulfobulbus sp.]
MKRIIETLFQRVGCLVMFLKYFQMDEPVQLAISYQGGTISKLPTHFGKEPKNTAWLLRGSDRRQFMAKVVNVLGRCGQSYAE